jgi:hypothetical protein
MGWISIEAKESMVQKVLENDGRKPKEIAGSYNVSVSTLR